MQQGGCWDECEGRDKPMNVLVAGLGGIGGFLGAKLAAAYPPGSEHKVHFLARGAHLEAIKDRGLTLLSQGDSLVAHPWAAAMTADGWPGMDLVLLCVKGYDLEGILQAMEPVVSRSTLIVPLQNGIGARSVVERHFCEALVADGAMYVFAHIQSPGAILHVGGPGRVVFGRDPGDQESLSPARDLLLAAGIQVKLVPRGDVEVWKKFVVLAAVAGSTALHGEAVGEILADPSKTKLMEGIMAEVISLATASGVPLEKDLLERTMATSRSFPPKGKRSLLHDLEASRPSELDWLLGRALELGRNLGVHLPVMEAVYQGIRARWLSQSPA